MAKYIFICASGHSGSTLLDRLLGAHSKIESLGEISHLPKNLKLNTQCTCGQPVRSCAVWQEVIKLMSSHLGIDIMMNPYALNLGYLTPRVNGDKDYHGLTNKIRKNIFHGLWFVNLRFNIGLLKFVLRPVYNAIKNNFVLYDSVLSVLNANMVVDSSKHYLKATELYINNPNEVRIIHLTRDGRGVYYSALKRNFKPEQVIKGWVNHYNRGISLLSRHVSQKHILRVKYENIATNPRKELGEICKFLEIEYEDKMLNFTGKPQHSTDGNNMRFSKSSKIIYDNVWEEKLSASDKRCFDSIGGDLNRKLGYDM